MASPVTSPEPMGGLRCGRCFHLVRPGSVHCATCGILLRHAVAPPCVPPIAMAKHRGTMVLVFGILGLLLCQVFGVVALIIGSQDLTAMKEGRMDPSGRGMTRAGSVLGLISLAMIVVFAALLLL